MFPSFFPDVFPQRTWRANRFTTVICKMAVALEQLVLPGGIFGTGKATRPTGALEKRKRQERKVCET